MAGKTVQLVNKDGIEFVLFAVLEELLQSRSVSVLAGAPGIGVNLMNDPPVRFTVFREPFNLLWNGIALDSLIQSGYADVNCYSFHNDLLKMGIKNTPLQDAWKIDIIYLRDITISSGYPAREKAKPFGVTSTGRFCLLQTFFLVC